MARSDAEWVDDILIAIADIRADTSGMDFAAFSATPLVVRSVLYSIAVIGEAAKNISDAFKAARPDIPWRAVAGIRDKIVHEYFRTNTRRIWDVVRRIGGHVAGSNCRRAAPEVTSAALARPHPYSVRNLAQPPAPTAPTKKAPKRATAPSLANRPLPRYISSQINLPQRYGGWP